MRIPKIFNVLTDSCERGDITSNIYYDWLLHHAYLLVPTQYYPGEFLMTLKKYPQQPTAASFNLEEELEKLKGIHRK